jgi:hypothetical protein
VAYIDLIGWSVTLWGPKGPLVGRCDPELDPGDFPGLEKAKKLKFSELDEINFIVTGLTR